ncbi:glycerol-3-phosphate dehydrogenase, putative [Acanthamoeba castellanii str. Neff]|uniref:Glycerol-3-phosphate dehydrogenase, putative n=1 Tax=Acanthamoeba castellanii (strain ATCC 30010 / Neff) TaxID=1257118 RepID=L8H3L7_ACACF|nr:glycerol-3-phosphate dehydrogenase, putative [Acanthamoeba castellanii str. Neff]ELR19805.1 glycerol-3-phosphate dehydrogenase, putative [Acanthamoeba castellanii str. Neff]
MEGGKEAMEQADIVVFGGGSFATALAYVLSKNHHTVTLLTRNEAVAQSINEQHRNPKYLSAFTLPPNVRASTRAEDVVPQARYIVHAVPVQASREYLQRLAPLIAPDTPIISSLSRNRTVGKRLGSGESLESILATMEEVAEGVATTPAACKLAEQYGLDLPIIKAVAAILRGDLQAREAVLHLMTLPLSDEKTW